MWDQNPDTGDWEPNVLLHCGNCDELHTAVQDPTEMPEATSSLVKAMFSLLMAAKEMEAESHDEFLRQLPPGFGV